MRLVNLCKQCNKPLAIMKSFPLSKTQVLQTYQCGHSYVEEVNAPEDCSSIVLKNVMGTKQARNYQEAGVEFIVNANGGFNCILADQMRIGKTPQALMALATGFRSGRIKKALILVRSANLFQWIAEYKDWCNSLPLGIWPIIGTKSFIPPAFSTYIMSMDTFSRKGMVDELLKIGFEVVIVDEAHAFKNPDSNRSKALIQFLHQINTEEITHTINFSCGVCAHSWQEEITVKIDHASGNQYSGKVAYCPACQAYNKQVSSRENIKKQRKGGCVLLSGTPVINRATEYFVPLNIVAPEMFPSKAAFVRKWIASDGKRINPWMLEEFRRTIAPYILRREKEDVYKDIPPITRSFTLISVEDQHLRDLYNATLDRMEENVSRKSGFNIFDNIGELAILRKICGLAKVDWTLDYIREAREENPDKRIPIGVHHHAVRDSLLAALGRENTLTLDGTDSPERKYEVMLGFRRSKELNLIIGMGAGKEGLELVYLDDALVLERAWSSAAESQFEYRFYNPDKEYLKSIGLNPEKRTAIEYVVAKGTIDEFFYDIVEGKRKMFGETIANNWEIEDDPTSFRELCERTIAGRL